MTAVITTERLILRAAESADITALYENVFSDPEVMAQAFYGKTFDLAEASAFFESNFDFSGTGKKLGVLTLKESGEIIGFSGLLPCNVLDDQDFEIGFVLGRRYWRKGYATEIGEAQITFGFEVLACRRLLGVVLPDNAASKAALIKSGMQYHSMVDTETRGTREVYSLSNTR